MEEPQSDSAWPADNIASQRWPLYTRGNIGEVFGDVILPLEWDLIAPGSEQGWRDGAKTLGFLTDDDFGDEDPVVMGVFGGYAYFNASIMRLLGVRTPGLSPEIIDQQFFGEAEAPIYQERPGDKNLVASLKMARTVIATLFAKQTPLAHAMQQRAREIVRDAPEESAADEDIWDFITGRSASETPYFVGGHVITTMRANVASGALADFCEKQLGSPDIALELTTGLGDVISAEPARLLWRLANEVTAEHFDAEFERFLDTWGHRGPNEFSMAGRDWRGHPEVARAAVEAMRNSPADRSPAAQSERISAARQARLSEVHAQLGRKSKALDRLIEKATLWTRAREISKDAVVRAAAPGRRLFRELVRRGHERGGVADIDVAMLLTLEEFPQYLSDPATYLAVIEQRRTQRERLRALEPPFIMDVAGNGGAPIPTSEWTPRVEPTAPPLAVGETVRGEAGAPGRASGTVRYIEDPSDPAALQVGDILMTNHTDPAWTPLFLAAQAVIVEVGAPMSHAMIVSRELGIPCVVGIPNVVHRIPDGATVTVDGTNGSVTFDSAPQV